MERAQESEAAASNYGSHSHRSSKLMEKSGPSEESSQSDVNEEDLGENGSNAEKLGRGRESKKR